MAGSYASNYKLFRLETPVSGLEFVLLRHPAPVVAIITIKDQRMGSYQKKEDVYQLEN